MAKKIKLSEAAQKQIETYKELITSCEQGLETLSIRLKDHKKALWDTIYEECPEAMQSYNVCTYQHDTKELIIAKKWEKSQEQIKFESVVKEMLKDGVEDIINEKIEDKFNQE